MRAIALDGRLGETSDYEQKTLKSEREKSVPLNETIHELYRQGWVLTRSAVETPVFWDDRPIIGSPVVFEFERKCGAKRQEVRAMPSRFDPYHRQAVQEHVSTWAVDDITATVACTVIDYEFRGFTRVDGGPYVAHYRER